MGLYFTISCYWLGLEEGVITIAAFLCLVFYLISIKLELYSLLDQLEQTLLILLSLSVFPSLLFTTVYYRPLGINEKAMNEIYQKFQCTLPVSRMEYQRLF